MQRGEATLGVSQVRPLNQVQRIGKTPIVERHVVQPHTWYTCPAGKVARVTGRFRCTGLGAASEARVEANSVQILEWRSGFPNTTAGINGINATSGATKMPVGVFAVLDVILEAGQTIETTQNSGTNAEFNGELEIQELPV